MPRRPTISVKGVGNVTVPPDITVIAFNMSAISRVYEHSVNELNERVEALRGALADVGVEPRELKTTRFGVDAEHEYENNRREFKGWKAQHTLRLELPVDRETLNRVLGAVTSADTESQLTVRFEVRDKAALRTRVLEDATRTARANAEAIASAAGCRLGNVIKITYGWSEVRFGSVDYELDRSLATASALAAPDIEPEDVDANDSVTVVWELVEG
jgi:uncharacterized protein YggE